MILAFLASASMASELRVRVVGADGALIAEVRFAGVPTLDPFPLVLPGSTGPMTLDIGPVVVIEGRQCVVTARFDPAEGLLRSSGPCRSRGALGNDEFLAHFRITGRPWREGR